MHLSFASPWVDTLDIPGEPTGTQGEWHSFGIYFFPRGGGVLFSFGNDFAGPWGHTTGFVRSSATGTVKNTLPATERAKVAFYDSEVNFQMKEMSLVG